MNQDKAEAFIRRSLLRSSPKVASVKLVHAVQGAGDAPLLTVDVDRGEESDLEEQVLAISRECADAASAHVDNAGGSRMQDYAIVCLSEQGRVVGQHKFRMRPSPDAIDSSDSEPANGTGILSMLMRHNEAVWRVSLMQSAGQIETLAKENERLSRRVRELEQDRERLFELREELASKAHEREIEAFEVAAKNARLDGMVERVAGYLPMVAEKIMGRNPGKELLESLTDEQQETIFAALRPEQVAMVGRLLEAGGDVGKGAS